MKNVNAGSLLEQANWTLVMVAGNHYALPSANVIQGLRAPRVQPVPFAPAHIAGIAQVDGEILPCLNLARLFGRSDEKQSAEEALVIEHDNRRTVLLIDTAQRQISLDEQGRDAIAALDSGTDQGQAVIGELRHANTTVLLLDPASLSHFSAQRAPAKGRPGLVAAHTDTQTDTRGDQQLDTLFLYVSINQQAYALRVNDVREIVEPGEIAQLPGAPDAVAGITLIRETSHLVVDAGRCLDIGVTDAEQAVIITVQQGELVLAVSGIDAVRAVPRHQVRPVGDSGARLDAVIEMPDEPVRAVINPQALVNGIRDVKQFVPDARKSTDNQAAPERSARFLVVSWGNERFALPLEKVLRLDPPATIRALQSDIFQGVISTGGEVVPVLLAAQFYGMSHQASELEGFMIIARGNVVYAVPMEHAERIIDVPESAIQRTSGASDQRFCGTIRYQGSLVSAVELSHFTELARAAQQELP